MEKKQEERKPMYFRDEAIGMKEFQQLTHPQQKDYVASLLIIEEDKLDFRDKYILNFYTKVYFPEKAGNDNKLFISMKEDERKKAI